MSARAHGITLQKLIVIACNVGFKFQVNSDYQTARTSLIVNRMLAVGISIPLIITLLLFKECASDLVDLNKIK